MTGEGAYSSTQSGKSGGGSTRKAPGGSKRGASSKGSKGSRGSRGSRRKTGETSRSSTGSKTRRVSGQGGSGRGVNGNGKAGKEVVSRSSRTSKTSRGSGKSGSGHVSRTSGSSKTGSKRVSGGSKAGGSKRVSGVGKKGSGRVSGGGSRAPLNDGKKKSGGGKKLSGGEAGVTSAVMKARWGPPVLAGLAFGGLVTLVVILVTASAVEVETGTACAVSADCPGEHPFDFCDPNFQCREDVLLCSEEVRVNPCPPATTCDEATRTCLNPVTTGAPLTAITPLPVGETLAELASSDLEGEDWDEAKLVEFDTSDPLSDDGAGHSWTYTFDATAVQSPSVVTLSVNFHQPTGVPVGGGGTWTLLDVSAGTYSIPFGESENFVTRGEFWTPKTLSAPIPEGAIVVDPVTKELTVKLYWDNTEQHRLNYLAVGLLDCPDCPSCSDAECTGNSYCHIGSGTCLCTPGWTGDDCTTRKVPAPLVDDPENYERDDPGAIYDLEVTILEDPGNLEGPNTWAEVQADIDYEDAFKPKVPCRFEVSAGPNDASWGQTFPAGLPNGVIKLRGEFSRQAAYPSYKVELIKEWIAPYSDDKRWRGFNRINLVKSPYDATRMRHNVMYELFRTVPDVPSWRSWFARLTFIYPDTSVVPYGLLSIIEDGRDRYTEDHKLSEDPDSDNHCLYKLRGWRFDYLDGMSVDDPYAVDEDDLEAEVDPKGCTDKSHHKLLKAIRDWNDYSIPVEDLVAEYVHMPNAMTHLALTLMLYDTDHDGKNAYLLTTPQNGNVFYWIPWDYDDALSSYRESKSNSVGLTNYITLSEHVYWWRIFRAYPNAINELTTTITNLHNGPLSQTNVRSQFESLLARIQNDADGDLVDNNEVGQDYLDEVEEKWMRVDPAYNEVIAKLALPVGIGWAGEIVPASGLTYEIEWLEGFSPHGRTISYDITVSTDPGHTNVVSQTNVPSELTPGTDVPFNIMTTSVSLSAATTYYVRIETVDSIGGRALGIMEDEVGCATPSEFGSFCFTT